MLSIPVPGHCHGPPLFRRVGGWFAPSRVIEDTILTVFCTECGKESAGKFCWNCGAPLHIADAAPVSSTAVPSEAPVDWGNETNYEALLRNPEVRDLLAKEKPATVRMTGEEFVDTFGKILNLPGSLTPVLTIMQEVNGRIGIHTGKSRTEMYDRPIGRVVVSALCAVAKAGYKVEEARQATDGCTLICIIPSDMFSFAGKLVITFRREPGGTSVQADTQIEGQLIDWGKSNRCISMLFSEVTARV